jgi:hypothetical protein
MKRATLVSFVLMIPVLSGGCAVDALYWGLTGFGMVSGQYQPDYGSQPDPCEAPVALRPRCFRPGREVGHWGRW